MINVNNLNKYYNKNKSNEIHVIDNTTIELPNSGLITILGQSGSGKTTLLNVLGGLDKASGIIEYDELKINKYNMNKIDKYRSINIGYIFQNYRLLPNETVYDNLKTALEIINITDSNEVDKRIKLALEAVNMYKYRKKKAYALSGGQQQRVSIARALIKNSKIIIADEPTGNLDSANTYEVMNILTEIAKESLVLLVTHDKNIAYHYSDKIIELNDGKVVNCFENEKMNSKLYVDNNIYLKDLEHKQISFNNIKIDCYGDDNIDTNIKLVYINNTLYIESNHNLKLVNETNINLVDEHKKISDDSDDGILSSFDISQYNNTVEKNKFKRILNNAFNSFINFINPSKKAMFLHIAMFLIGAVMALSIVALITATTIDISAAHYNSNYYSIINKNKNKGSYTISKEAFDDSAINNLVTPIKIELDYTMPISFNESLRIDRESYVLPYVEEKLELTCGNYPIKDNEIVLSKTLADKIIKKCSIKIDYSNLIGTSLFVINNLSYQFDIVGISNNDQGINYVNMDMYKHIAFDINEIKSTTIRLASNEYSLDNEKLYEVVLGRDLNPKNKYEVLIRHDEKKNVDKRNQPLQYPYWTTINKKDYLVVGTFEHKYHISNDTYISNHVSYASHLAEIGSFPNSSYSIIEGRDIENDSEAIVPAYSRYMIGDVVDGLTIVGRYTGSSIVYAYRILTSKNTAVLNSYSDGMLFDIINEEKLNELALKSGYEFYVDIKTKALALHEINQVNVILFESLFIVLFIVSVIFIYFIMKSKVINDIYNIGVYRSLGESTKRIYLRYFIDNIVLTLFTSMIGYLIIAIGYSFAYDIIYPVNTYNALMGSRYYMIIGGVALVISMLIFGMLPVRKILKMTPTEICMKYDI